MKISKSNLKKLIENFLILEESSSKKYTINFSKATVVVRRLDNNKFNIIQWPSDYNGKPVSENNPMPLEAIKGKVYGTINAYEVILQEIEGVDKRDKGEFEKKYKFEPDAGYPVILCNVMSKPISKKFIDMIPKDYKSELDDLIPEGHVFLLLVEPRTRRIKRFDFGVFDQSEGGSPNCLKGNGAKDQGILGFSAIGSFVLKDLGIEADLVKKESNYVLTDKSLNDIISKAKNQTQGSPDIDYAVINGCKHINKTIATAKTNDCAPYNVVPSGWTASIINTFESMSDFITGDQSSSTIPGDSGDNCATMSYKLAYLAKNGNYPGNLDSSILQYPPKTINYVKNNLV